MNTKKLTAERARELLAYDEESGGLTRKVSLTNSVKIGATAGSVNKKGYVALCVDGKYYLAHRVVWLMAYGEWPKDQIDHINGIKTDNRLSNLRVVCNTINTQNKLKPSAKNSSGLLGVSWMNSAKKWRAQIQVQGKVKYLGLFTDKNEAHEAYLAAKRQYHNEAVSRHS